MELYASKATRVRFERHEIESGKCGAIGREQVRVGEDIKKCFFQILKIGSQLTFPKMVEVQYI